MFSPSGSVFLFDIFIYIINPVDKDCLMLQEIQEKALVRSVNQIITSYNLISHQSYYTNDIQNTLIYH